MALTKSSFYIAIPVFVLILIALQNFGNELLITNGDMLTESSQDYIESYKTNMGGISDYDVSTSTVNQTKGNPFDVYGEDKTTSAFEFGVVSFFKSIFSTAFDFVSRIYNLPTFLVNTLGLNVYGSWTYVVNTVVYILSFALLIYAVKFVNGGA